jgi:hypothetical protein
MEEVTKEQFYKFIDNYEKKLGRKLDLDITGICEPPLVTYNDFNLGKWPKSVVAECYKISNDKCEGYKVLNKTED